MKNIVIIFVLFFSTHLTSCKSPLQIMGNKYTYTHTLLGDNVKNNVYEDNDLQITFTITTKQIDFALFNKSENPIKIIWDEASYIPFMEGKRVIHKEVKYADRDKSQLPTTIPSKTFWKDLLVPTENVSYGSYSGWSSSDIWIEYDYNKQETSESILALKGLKYRILLPMEVNGSKKNYTFNFEISDIVKNPYQPKPVKQGLPF